MPEETSNQSSGQDRYVPFSEALELFKPLDRNRFNYRVRTNEIGKIKGEGKRDAEYSVKDILKVKEEILRKDRLDITFDWLKPQDITAAMDLDYLLYNEYFIGEAQLYQSWRYKNPRISMAAFDANNRRRCWGYIGLIPLPENVILAILQEKRDELSIRPEEIEDYSRPGGYALLANSAAVHPDHPDLLYKIMYKLMDFWISQYPERYIKKIYAQAVSEKGEIMVQHFFMTPRPDLAYNAYELDLTRPSASKVIRWFKDRLIAKSPLPEDLQYPPVRRT